MKRYLLLDGTLVGGRTYADVVRSMAGMKMTKPRSLETYRQATATRASDMYGKKVDPTSDATFVKTMVAAGLLETI